MFFPRPELLVQKIAKCSGLNSASAYTGRNPATPHCLRLISSRFALTESGMWLLLFSDGIKAFKENPTKDLATNKISCLPQICLNLCCGRSWRILQGTGDSPTGVAVQIFGHDISRKKCKIGSLRPKMLQPACTAFTAGGKSINCWCLDNHYELMSNSLISTGNSSAI